MAHFDSSGQSSHTAGPSITQEKSADGLIPARIRIVLAMAAELDRMAWSIVIDNQSDMELVAATSSSRQLIRLLKLHSPDVVLLDEVLLDQCHPGSLQTLARKSACRFVLVAMHQPDYSLEPPRISFLHARLLKGVSAPELLRTLRAAGAASRGRDASALASSSPPLLDSLS